MLSHIEALEALSIAGTMAKAGTRLRVSQSAVSKRIAALEARLGASLVEKRGRRAVLTPRATRLLERLGPVLAELRSVLADEHEVARGAVTLGVSESIMASWGPALLRQAVDQLPGLSLELHTHRSPVVVERVAAGEYLVGLIAGTASDAAGLHVVELAREPMALIPSGLDLAALPRGDVPVLTIEARSGTWDAIERRARQLGLVPERRLESFFAVARLALTGFGHALVPYGVCAALQLRDEDLRIFSRAELSRPISLVARRSAVARPLVEGFVAALVECRGALVAGWP